ncbi:hypothetical protein LIER_07952 [Lithospermum erythrorhizon]|uniref:Uncharacterized protein n=1 Tax=Lithospermum erythrorhizon TaxID=34254 RepID=A0AAV3PC52_LITER
MDDKTSKSDNNVASHSFPAESSSWQLDAHPDNNAYFFHGLSELGWDLQPQQNYVEANPIGSTDIGCFDKEVTEFDDVLEPSSAHHQGGRVSSSSSEDKPEKAKTSGPPSPSITP